jgi:hypothetical protein
MQTDSECESDVSSIADSSTTNPNQLIVNREHLLKRMDSLTQENRVLKVELETYKLRLKASQQEIKQLKQFVHFSIVNLNFISVFVKCKCSYASESRTRRRIYFKYTFKKNSRIKKRKRNFSQ